MRTASTAELQHYYSSSLLRSKLLKRNLCLLISLGSQIPFPMSNYRKFQILYAGKRRVLTAKERSLVIARAANILLRFCLIAARTGFLSPSTSTFQQVRARRRLGQAGKSRTMRSYHPLRHVKTRSLGFEIVFFFRVSGLQYVGG